MYTKSLKGRSVISVIASSGPAKAAPPLPAWNTPMTVDQVSAYGINWPCIPPIFSGPSRVENLLLQLTMHKIRIRVFEDQIALHAPNPIPESLTTRFDQLQPDMLELFKPKICAKQVQAAVDWLQEFGTQTDSICTEADSDLLRHVAGAWNGRDISNGAFIVAALREGYTAVPCQMNKFDAVFNLSVTKWRAAVRQLDLEDKKLGYECRMRIPRRYPAAHQE